MKPGKIPVSSEFCRYQSPGRSILLSLLYELEAYSWPENKVFLEIFAVLTPVMIYNFGV